MMVHNPITEEIREIRHRLAAQFDNDITRIGDETRRRQALSGRRVVRLSRRIPENQIPANKPFQRRHLSHRVKWLIGFFRIWFFKR